MFHTINSLTHRIYLSRKGEKMNKALKQILKVFICIVMVIVALLVILLVKNYIHSQMSWLKKDYYTKFESSSELEKKYSGIGNFQVSNATFESDDIMKEIRIWYPSQLEDGNQEYPLIMVTNASETAAKNYEAFFERLASWGFVVVGNDDRQAGSGLSTSKALDYVLNLNDNKDSIFYQKIDRSNIGAVGYSQGGAGAINAVTAFDNSSSYKALFTGSAAYSLLSKNMGWEYDISKVRIPYFMSAGTGKSDDTGVSDIETEYGGVAPLASLVENYNGISDDVFKIRGRVVGTEHDEMQARTDGYMTAWMLYQLKGDEIAGKAFIGDEAEILKSSNWQDVEKNK